MLIKIKYFGQIAETTQLNEESVEFSGQLISDLIKILLLKYDALKHKNFKVAQNQELVAFETQVTGSEIALLPPFAGG